jgi:transposase
LPQSVGLMARRDLELLGDLIDLPSPWVVTNCVADHHVHGHLLGLAIYVELDAALPVRCPRCGEQATRHGSTSRMLSHFPAFGRRCNIFVKEPRVKCKGVCGYPTISIPETWAEAGFTVAFKDAGLHDMAEQFYASPLQKRRPRRGKASL